MPSQMERPRPSMSLSCRKSREQVCSPQCSAEEMAQRRTILSAIPDPFRPFSSSQLNLTTTAASPTAYVQFETRRSYTVVSNAVHVKVYSISYDFMFAAYRTKAGSP